MLTKQNLIDSAFADIDLFPKLATLYRANDPRIIQPIAAVATMLSAVLQHQETAHLEPFKKERPSTIYADAAMRGIVPRSKGVRVRLSAENPGLRALVLEAGRTVMDSTGNMYTLETPLTVAPGETGSVVVQQGVTVTSKHTVQNSEPFYAIPVPDSNQGTISTIAMWDETGPFEWRNRYTNTAVGERVFHIEIDDRQKTYIRMGCRDVVGLQPNNGAVLTLKFGYTQGNITPDAESPFSLEYTNNVIEAGAKLKAVSIVESGEDPVTLEVLAELARYPSTYSDDAVFLGEFDYLVRKKFPSLQFGSVWNEAHEELVRGPNIKSTNCLFVAALSADGTEQVLEETGDEKKNPVLIDENDLTPIHKAIRKAIKAADDSYRVRFYTPVISEIAITVSARVSSAYISADVEAQIKAALLKAYGKQSAAAKRGYNRPLYQKVYKLLEKEVPALSGGDTDWQLNIAEPSGEARPELWRYVSEASLKVIVKTVNIVIPSWGG